MIQQQQQQTRLGLQCQTQVWNQFGALVVIVIVINVGQKKILGTEKNSGANIWVKKKFWFKKISGCKKMLAENIFGRKKFWVKKPPYQSRA